MSNFIHGDNLEHKIRVEKNSRNKRLLREIVLDPFNGVGTTTLVAFKSKRKYIGIDISREYCEIAKKRIKNVPPTLF